MTTAADLIQFLLRRTQLKAHRLPPPGEFPPGWKQWLAAMKLRPGHVTGAAAEDIVGELARRMPAAPPARASDLTRWQSFSTLWRQEWQPPEPEDRRIRVAAGSISVLWHALFAALLVWLMYLQYFAVAPPPQGEDVVQVEYIGTGTPEEAGGVEPAPAPAPAGGTPSPGLSIAPAQSAPPPAPSAAVEVPGLEAPLPDIPQRDVPEPVIPPAVAEQAVAVSEPTPVTEPDAFVLPPPQTRIADVQVSAPELRAPSRELQVVDVPAPVQPIQRALPQPVMKARPIEAPTPEIAARDVPAPLPRLPTREIAAPTIEQPRLSASTPQVRERAVPAPSRPAAPAADTATATSPAASSAGPSAQTDAASASSPAASAASAPPGQTGNRPAAMATGAGPMPTPAPGGLPSPRRSDDWGDSTRTVPGGQRGDPAGVFDSDGSIRLARTPGSAAPGQPPGTVTQEIADLDRAGTWLKRKPTDYEPSAFDRYWLPHETLLAEWVRKGVKQVAIPIPGTSKNIVCVVSLLQLGGGCGISDPNLSEQPASARPPPDIPFKPHLQEDNGSAQPGG